jgi:hypothetical protein
MGSVNYNFLANSILLHEKSIKNQFKNETDERLENELIAYREFCISNYSELIEEITKTNSFLKVFTSIENTPIDLLKQTALYIQQFIIPDPLFKLTEPKNESSDVTSKYLGYQSSSFDKNKLSLSCKFLKNITPMAVGNFVKLFPLSYFFERSTIPFYAPKDQFFDVLPAEILKYFREKASVSSLEKMSSGGWQIMEGTLYPCRGIAVDFKDADLYSGMIFHLVQSEVVEVNKESRTVLFRQTLPDTPPEKEEFDAWVNQSINSASRKLFNEIFQENIIAADLNSTYLCDNLFTSNLISKHFETKDSIQNFTANQIINIEVPFLQNIDIQKLMTIREADADTFTNFRLELEKQFRELRSVTDERTLKIQSENILHELNDVQGEKIRQKMNHIKSQMGTNALLAVGGLIGSFQTSGVSLAATALAVGKGYKDYKENVRENPAFLLWKIRQK